MIFAISGSSYDSWSITWHQWHHTAPMSRRIGLSSAFAFANASSPHGYQSTGWWAAPFRYEDASFARRFVLSGNARPHFFSFAENCFRNFATFGATTDRQYPAPGFFAK